jgi:DNA-binding protein HU-beta
MALTQTQLADAVAEQAGITRNEAKNVLTALEEVILGEIGNAQKVKIGNLVQLTVRLKPATKARQGRNPATGEEITISAKPASVDVRARALAKAKAALPSLAKAKKSREVESLCVVGGPSRPRPRRFFQNSKRDQVRG